MPDLAQAPQRLRIGFGRLAELVFRRPAEVGTDEGQYPPQVIVGRDDRAHRRDGGGEVLHADARVALALQHVAPQRNEPEERVVVSAVHPRVVDQRRADAPAAIAAVAAVLAVTHVPLVSGLDDRRIVVGVRILELPLGRRLDAIRRLHGIGGGRGGRRGGRGGGGGGGR